MADADQIRRRLLFTAPLLIGSGLGYGFLKMLQRMAAGDYDPHGVPNPIVGKKLPDFSLPGFSSQDVLDARRPAVINFFASWCVPCLQEAPALLALQQQGVALWGIAYKDKPAQTAAFLARNGNPFAQLAHDDAGSVAIDWGVYGVPETYFVNRAGIVRWRWVGALNQGAGLNQLHALLARYG